MLATGGLNRSVDTVVYVIIGTLTLLLGSALLLLIGTLGLMFLRMFIKSRRGHVSVAASAFEAVMWSELLVSLLVVAVLMALGVASLEYEPLRSLWTVPPSETAVAIFVAAAIAVIISLKFYVFWERKLFLRPALFTETKLPDGRTRIEEHDAGIVVSQEGKVPEEESPNRA